MRPILTPASDRSLLVSFGDTISLEIHRAVTGLTDALAELSGRGGLDVHPGYTTVLITFDPRHASHAHIEDLVGGALRNLDKMPPPQPRTIEIPVTYGGSEGPDLADVAQVHGLTPERVAEIHCSAEYVVYFLGFSPGFAYLGGLPESIATPRLDRPRTRVPAGSVAIGGRQTGVYPTASPGGWRIIGRTSLALFAPDAEQPTLLRTGDRVHFRRAEI